MKKLIFVRHAKAEEETPGLSDFERSLTSSGKRVSKQMAEIFHKREGSPGLIITSPAFRALETALIFAGITSTSYDKIILRNNLYFGTNLDKLMRVLTTIDDDVKTITLFGHNPSFTDLPDALSRNGCGPVPKTGIVCLSFDIEKWTEVSKRGGKLEYFLKPEKKE
jgi:phosphohistidine phosphatase